MNKRGGEKYTPKEDQMILERKVPDKELCELLGRTRKGIKNRRWLLLNRDEINRRKRERRKIRRIEREKKRKIEDEELKRRIRDTAVELFMLEAC